MNNRKKLLKISLFILITASTILISIWIASCLNSCTTCQPGFMFQHLTIGPLTLAALADSINPCALAVLMILLEGLMLIRKNILKTGFAFIAGIFVSYLLIGLGLLTGFQLIKNAALFHQIVAVLAIIVGLLNIKDYFWYGKLIKMEIPMAWRPKLGSTIQKATHPLIAFLIGIVVSFFELPCTGGPYLFALGLLKESHLKLPWLLYYNLLFILPLIVIVLLVFYSYVRIERTEEWRKRNIKLFHLVGGIVMLGLGTWLISIG